MTHVCFLLVKLYKVYIFCCSLMFFKWTWQMIIEFILNFTLYHVLNMFNFHVNCMLCIVEKNGNTLNWNWIEKKIEMKERISAPEHQISSYKFALSLWIQHGPTWIQHESDCSEGINSTLTLHVGLRLARLHGRVVLHLWWFMRNSLIRSTRPSILWWGMWMGYAHWVPLNDLPERFLVFRGGGGGGGAQL